MFLEIEDETRDFKTTYRNDYLRRKTKRPAAAKPPINFIPPLNPCNEPFKEHLNSLRKNEKLPEEERSEDLRDNLQRIKAKYPHLQRFLPADTPDENLLEQEQKKNFKTVYQLNYSKNLDDYLSLTAKKAGNRKFVTLPENWVIPETTQRRSYRNFYQIAPNYFMRTIKFSKPPNNLDPNLKEREILRIRTGDSEYGGVISATGDYIMKEKLFGEPISLESPRLDSSQSFESESDSNLMRQKRPFISNVF